MADDVFELLGRTIDEKVRVEESVGEGGFAVVYRGFHLAFEHPVAVKCLKVPAHFDEEARVTFLRKFQEEGKMLFRLSQHASIVRVFDIGELEAKGLQVPYLVLEWLDGVDLESVMKERAGAGMLSLSESEALRILRPGVDAIALAHRLGIAHRDLKPSNLVLANTVQGELLKVLDFGIAKAMQAGETTAQRTTHTSSGFHAFSPQYGAPEQFRSKRFGGTGPWTDVHALGLILTELVVGRPAMLGEEYADFYEQAMDEGRPTPRACGVEVSEAFETLCRRCLAREPEARFPDAETLLAAMDAMELGVRDLMHPQHAMPPASAVRASNPSNASAAEVAQTEIAGAPEVPSLVPPEAREDADDSDGRGVSSAPPSAPSAPGSTTIPDQSPSSRDLPAARGRSSRWPLLAAAGAVVATGAVILGWWLPAREQAELEQVVGPTAPVPAGSFLMGTDEGAPDQRPEHEVAVQAFALDLHEVTVQAFALCVKAGACSPTETVHLIGVPESEEPSWNAFCNWGKPGRETHPMNCVDWNQAKAFCAWAGKRLPTEQQWEYAACGGDEERTHPWGETGTDKASFNGCGLECVKMALEKGWKWKPLHNAEDPWPATAPVGTFPDSAGKWGHQDLAGNVWEWTASPYCTYGSRSDDACSKLHRVARGGGWASRYPGIFRGTFRTKFPPEYRAQDVGFRCAR